MIGRVTVETLNQVINDPAVLAALAPGYERLDASGFLSEPGMVALGDERGVLIFRWLRTGIYEFHYALTPALRGREAIRVVRAALDQVFTRHHARVIVGATPRGNRAARAMNRALGARPIGELCDSQGRDCIIYILDRETWATSSAASQASPRMANLSSSHLESTAR